MKMINVEGVDVVVGHIVAIGDVASISTGPMICDWDYGFEIITTNGKIGIPVPTDTDSCGNHILSREGRYRVAKEVRNNLVEDMSIDVTNRNCNK